jgi:hypothetical protein
MLPDKSMVRVKTFDCRAHKTRPVDHRIVPTGKSASLQKLTTALQDAAGSQGPRVQVQETVNTQVGHQRMLTKESYLSCH